jgi:S-adenosylmethionine synthetase
MRVVVTGGSGLLGRAIVRVFTAGGAEVVGTAMSRVKGALKQLDITDKAGTRSNLQSRSHCAAVIAFMNEYRPDVIVHAAAERRPDKCEGDEGATTALNVDGTRNVIAGAAAVGAFLIYISTDYGPPPSP